VEHQDGKPSRKIYHITKSGQREFKRWLAESPKRPQLRNDMLIKVFFGNQMDPAQFAAHLLKWRDYHAHLLKRYGDEVPLVIEQYAHATGALEDAPYWTLTLDYGRKLDRGVLEWCDEALKKIVEKGKKGLGKKKWVSPSKKLGKS
jgi:hypothetical protein